ncbi:unnamed protein product [Rotaria magnacalcarata]|uniref:Coiled-coil domain-containing protein n=4 Tax=Rotaria magnacalcarata TaxID=392030 RepID=A0A815LU76_9BILA|nr:unnamed protein product [Rotaria magnacalcarata]CAF1414828.1 unnamed protein product [Rotaria magnacalcarata]CAF2086786.1 unnamed protein product [Rotaria magnacalcarata]CAF2150512.1 unnamed protein product [Rotaria magnacalcarata]CAF3811275.1 unnamed protein product [Rotaria magnacalcarata]
MIKKEKELDMMSKTNDQTKPGHVKQICQHFLTHADSGLAHRLQEEEFAVHFDRNRTHRHESRLGVKTARDVEEEEKKEYFTKQLDFYQQKHKIEENDIALARKLQEEMKIKSNAVDRADYNFHHDSFNDQNPYEEIDDSTAFDDISSDEQLARILQEEEQLLASANVHSHVNPKFR